MLYNQMHKKIILLFTMSMHLLIGCDDSSEPNILGIGEMNINGNKYLFDRSEYLILQGHLNFISGSDSTRLTVHFGGDRELLEGDYTYTPGLADDNMYQSLTAWLPEFDHPWCFPGVTSGNVEIKKNAGNNYKVNINQESLEMRHFSACAVLGVFCDSFVCDSLHIITAKYQGPITIINN